MMVCVGVVVVVAWSVDVVRMVSKGREGVVFRRAEGGDARAEGQSLKELMKDDDDEESNEKRIASDDKSDTND